MRVPIGISNFRELITETSLSGQHYLFVDKSLFIRDILDHPSKVILITRPRRFGKTLNMSMLHHFLAREIDGKSTGKLFDNLKIAKHTACMQHQGQYPVIYLTFKDVKSGSFEDAYANLCNLIAKAYEKHAAILTSEKLTTYQKEQYSLILERKASVVDMQCALQNLTFYLYQCYGVKPVVLIDEYDTPIQTGHLSNYYQEIIAFMREFLSTALKDNAYLHKAVLTGILRVSKESLFFGLNHLDVYTLLNSNYGEYFGFTEAEVQELLVKADFNYDINAVKTWYNGYQAGNTVIYNPWSIINYLKNRGELNPYWVNTSDNILIKELLVGSSTSFKEQFEVLMQDKAIERLIDDNFVFPNLAANESIIWTLLFMAGYLKITASKTTELGTLCQLEIPNKEVKLLYKVIIASWLSGFNDASIFSNFLTDFLAGKMDRVEDSLRTIMTQTFSVHDVKGKEPEKFYHGFMLGLLAGIDRNQYKIASNKESGLGRYDIALIPNDITKLGVVLELKSLGNNSEDRLQVEADAALQQIDSKQYVATMLQHKLRKCLKLGITFSGKELAMAYRIDEF